LQRSDGRYVRTLNGVDRAACGTGEAAAKWDFVSDVALTTDGTLYVALPKRMQVQVCSANSREQQQLYGARGQPYLPGDSLYNGPGGVWYARGTGTSD
jgi:hypothetical protein